MSISTFLKRKIFRRKEHSMRFSEKLNALETNSQEYKFNEKLTQIWNKTIHSKRNYPPILSEHHLQDEN